MTTQDRIKISRFAHPDILLARIARYVGKSIFLQNIVNETGAIHSAICRISGAVSVTEILPCQLEPGLDDLLHFWRISFIARDFVRRNSDIWRALSLRRNVHCRRRHRSRSRSSAGLGAGVFSGVTVADRDGL